MVNKKITRLLANKHSIKIVHQEDLNMNEKILRHFDLSSQYGVCFCPHSVLYSIAIVSLSCYKADHTKGVDKLTKHTINSLVLVFHVSKDGDEHTTWSSVRQWKFLLCY